MTEAWIGAAASAAACIVSNPIDIIRCRMQLITTSRPAAAPGSLLQRWGPLHAGLGPAMGYNVALNATRFALFHELLERREVNPMVAGFLSGGLAGFLSSPLAQWRTLLQAGVAATRARQIVVSKPFAGAPAWALRNAGHTACIFSLFDVARLRLDSACDDADRSCNESLVHLASSLLAATGSCVLMNPLDVYCTRRYHASQPPSSPGVGGNAAAAGAAGMEDIIRCRMRAGYRGLSANLLRTVPHTCITFVVAGALRSQSKKVSSTSGHAMPTSESQSRKPIVSSSDVTRGPSHTVELTYHRG